jgi:hypothetical protein
MAIFSRRTIQQMLNENSDFLTETQIIQHVTKLNQDDFQAFDTEWEVAILNVFSKIGKVVHEPDLGGSSRLDLLFTPNNDAKNSMVADITTVSDDGFEIDNPVKDFYVELTERITKAGLSGNGFNLSIGAHPQKYGEPTKIKLPPRGEFANEIFNGNFKSFLNQILTQPEQPAVYRVSNEKTELTLSYTPGKRFFSSTWHVYNQALEKTKNPIFNSLKAKQRQIKKTNYSGSKGIILCDAGSDMPHKQSFNSFETTYNADDAIRDFLRQNQSIDFVLMISSVWTGKTNPFTEGKTRKILVSVFKNKNYETLPESIKESLENLEEYFPEPVNTASGARETIRRGFDLKSFKPLGGGLRGSAREISIPSSSVFALLAGKITQDELFESLGFKPSEDGRQTIRNLFEYKLEQKMRIVEVKVEPRAYDDDMLTFVFDGPDPAISPFVVPQKTKNQGAKLK